MPSQNEMQTIRQCQNHIDQLTRERDKLQTQVYALKAEIEQGERLLEAEQAEMQAQRVKHDQEKLQLAQAAEIAMQRATDCRKRAEQAENRAAIFQQATDTMVKTIAELWKLIPEGPPHTSETPQGYPREAD